MFGFSRKKRAAEESRFRAFAEDAVKFVWDGDKYPAHFGVTKDYEFTDYWTLRRKSLQLFTENPYCRGIIRRILRNEIFTGLVPNATPNASVLWPDMDEMEREERALEAAEKMNAAFSLYSQNYEIFDCKKQLTFGEWQEQVRLETLLCGDGIIISRINRNTGLPMWEFINGDHIKDPPCFDIPADHTIKHGVELDWWGRHVAYYVETVRGNGEVVYERIPVKGKKSGRQIAWMVYGSEHFFSDVRGEPLLAAVLGILKELDRYRDAEERAAVVNAMLAFFVKRPANASASSSMTAGLSDFKSRTRAAGGADTVERTARPPIKIMEPGTVIDDLAAGEDLQSFNTQRPNVNYKAFEQAILDAVCWSLEIPPEIVTMKFTSSYSASRQANNEFGVYLRYRCFKNAKDFCQIIYEEFIIQACLNGWLSLPGFLAVCNDGAQWQKRAAWLSCAWTGLNRPSVDALKEVNASRLALDEGLTTYDIEARKTCGVSFRQVMLARKNEQELMANMGFTPHSYEDNNGKPAYKIGGEEETESGSDGDGDDSAS